MKKIIRKTGAFAVSVMLAATMCQGIAFAEETGIQGETDAQNVYAEEEVIVAFKDDITVNEAEEICGSDVEPILTSGEKIKAQQPTVVSVDNVTETIEELSENEEVEYVQPNFIYTCNESGKEKSTVTTGWNYKYLNIKAAWKLIEKLNLPKERVHVAVIDTGVSFSHPDMTKNVDKTASVKTVDGTIKSGYKAVYAHGTKLASIIGADSNNGIGIDGIGSGSKNDLISMACINVFADTGRVGQFSATTKDILAGLAQAEKFDAKLINMAMGTLSSYTDRNGEKHDDVALGTEIEKLLERGRTVVVSAGNQDSDEYVYPSDFEGVISAIAAKHYTNAWGNIKKGNSNYGLQKTVCAPAEDVWACNLKGYSHASSTSAASAHVSGVCALVLAVDKTLSPGEVKEIISETAVDVYKDGQDAMTGYGMVNAYNAVKETALRAAERGTLVNSNGETITLSEVEKIAAKTVPDTLTNAYSDPAYYRPSITGFKKKKGEITLKWKSRTPATLNYYKIYRSESKSGTYECVKTISNGKKEWTDTNVKSGTRYYYKIKILGTSKDGKKRASTSREFSIRSK